MTSSLAPSCAICHATTPLSVCAGCKVVQYCSRAHQVQHRSTHKRICKMILSLRTTLGAEQAEEAMLNHFACSAMPAWLQSGTTLDPLLKVAAAELEVDTRLAVRSGRNRILEMAARRRTRCSGPRIWRRCAFCGWWWITVPESTLSPPKQPYISVKNADIFEPATIFMGKCASLSLIASLTLLKLWLLMDLQSLERSRKEVGTKLSQELADEIAQNMVSSTITRKVMERDEHTVEIAKLTEEVKELYRGVGTWNEHYWPAVLYLGVDLKADPESWNYGDKQVRDAACFAGSPQGMGRDPGRRRSHRGIVKGAVRLRSTASRQTADFLPTAIPAPSHNLVSQKFQADFPWSYPHNCK
ncbi:hypothetical protein K458DRAFT_491028 [Lentithecium fluviatile CBS 122367]|uniref:MYND-type domain-containing protein n=1 Tax=Lentithecium fluviatile CBS 122367 TaxID=1168545 RepID=A0A6G1ILB7_9PLEO|nr:hypothetical protein K458DRAFT_491028 [Lentithecium fluviatile CBS 122367]